MKVVTALAATCLLAGCPDRTIAKVTPGQTVVDVKDIPVSADIDILFVIDNSASTTDKQTVFAANFPKFVAALDAFPTGRPNLHIGVVDSTVDIGVDGFMGCPHPDPGDNGLLQNTARVAGCTAPTGQFLSDIKNASNTRTVNYAGTLDTALSCIAQVGAGGCGFEAQLEAMKRALDGSQPANAGFVRDGAYLAIIFLTDEDDASTKDSTVFTLDDAQVGGRNDFRVQPLFAYDCDTPISASMAGTYTNCKPRLDSYLQDPAYYAQFLSTVKPVKQTVVAMIAAPPPGLTTNDTPPQKASSQAISTGPVMLNGLTQPLALEPSCSAMINGNSAVGRPGVRLASFLSNFGDHGKFYSICQGDYSAALTDIGNFLFQQITPCLGGALDTTDADPTNPGVQLQCAVTDRQNDGTTNETDTVIPQCPMQDATTPTPTGPRPCFYTPIDMTSCPAANGDTGYELIVVRSAPPSTGTTTHVECALMGS